MRSFWKRPRDGTQQVGLGNQPDNVVRLINNDYCMCSSVRQDGKQAQGLIRSRSNSGRRDKLRQGSCPHRQFSQTNGTDQVFVSILDRQCSDVMLEEQLARCSTVASISATMTSRHMMSAHLIPSLERATASYSTRRSNSPRSVRSMSNVSWRASRAASISSSRNPTRSAGGRSAVRCPFTVGEATCG